MRRLAGGCGVSRNDESVDTLAYITWKAVTAPQNPFRIKHLLQSIKTNILDVVEKNY